MSSNDDPIMFHPGLHTVMAIKPFVKHQCYTEPGSTRLLKCDCGSGLFEVGIDDFLTVVRCPKCGLEKIIHDG